MSEIIFGCTLLILIGISFFGVGKVAAGITCVASGAFIIGCLFIATAISGDDE